MSYSSNSSSSSTGSSAQSCNRSTGDEVESPEAEIEVRITVIGVVRLICA
jgi:hypothetical protein